MICPCSDEPHEELQDPDDAVFALEVFSEPVLSDLSGELSPLQMMLLSGDWEIVAQWSLEDDTDSEDAPAPSEISN